MKSHALFAIAPLALVVTLAGCGGEKKTDEITPDSAARTPATTTPAQQEREQPPPAPPTPPAAPDAPTRPKEEPSASPAAEPPTIVPEVPKPDPAAPAEATTAVKEERKPSPPQETNASIARDVTVLTGSPMGGVRLDHRAHAQRAGTCTSCHHPSKPQKPASRPQQACSDCHTKVAAAPMKTKYQSAFHNPTAQSGTCIDCHRAESAKGKKAPMKCAECHRKENT